MHPRCLSSCLFVGISLVLLIGAECKPVQVRSLEPQQPPWCRENRPKSGRLTCSDETKLRRYFFHRSKSKGCKIFSICPSAAAQHEANINDTEENYYTDFRSCQMDCMTHVQCPELPENHLTYVEDGLQGWGGKVTYECINGYSLSQNIRKPERICQKNGTWSGEPPVCLQQCTAPPAIAHANIAPAKDLHNQMSTVHYSCDVGYRLEGYSQRMCGREGEWDNTEPSCVCAVARVNGRCSYCPEPSPIENGNVLAPNRTIDAVINYTCKEQYILVGNSSRNCLQEGMWSGDEPVCWKVKIEMGLSGSDKREDVTNKTATVEVGSSVVFRAITTDPNPFNINFEWLFNGKTKIPHSLEIVGKLLTFRKILKTREQDGDYTITFGDFNASFTLNISEPNAIIPVPPIIINDHTMDITTSIGATVRFQCIASLAPGSTVLNITWYHNNVTLTQGTRHWIEAVTSDRLAIGVLSISLVERDDEGHYHCLAENIAGNVSSAAVQLRIESVTRRFAEENTEMTYHCSQKTGVTLLGRVMKTTSNLDLIKSYKVHIKRILHGSSKMEALGRSKSIQTVLLRDVSDNMESLLKANSDYVFQGRLFDNVLLVSRDNVYKYTPSLQKHLVSC